jgi:hypothetical protein
MSKPIKRINIVIVLTLVLSVFFFVTNVWGGEVTPLSGITVPDEYPNGCVSCHVKVSDDKDLRLIAVLKKVEKHPAIEKMVKTVPSDCLKCHKEGSKAGLFNLITHKNHFSNPQENAFVSNYKGNCLACHTLDKNTFIMSIKSGPANW